MQQTDTKEIRDYVRLGRKPESVQEYETHKIPLDFDIQTDHPILARRSDLVVILFFKVRTCIKRTWSFFTFPEN